MVTDRLAGVRGPVALPVLAVLGAVALSSCGSSGVPAPADSAPEVSAEIVQLRRDEVLERVEIAVRNAGTEEVVVERLTLRVPGFRGVGPVRKDSPVPPGQVVNLPVPHGVVSCDEQFRARVGEPRVTLRMRAGTERRLRTVRLRPTDPRGLLTAIADRACTVRRVESEVTLRFGDEWRTETRRGETLARGSLEAVLVVTEPRQVTQVAGTVIYGLRPAAQGAPGAPLASLTRESPRARIPVVVESSRCDGHAIGEVKKPYAFLVWVADAAGEEVAVTPQAGPATLEALQRVCRL